MNTNRILINDCLKMSDNELSEISDDTIRRLDYGIKYFDFGAAGIRPTQRDWDVMEILRNRLGSLETKSVVHKTEAEIVLCDCGHTVEKILRMNASSGTCCPDCYDRMSW